jgi:hypothetical protein
MDAAALIKLRIVGALLENYWICGPPYAQHRSTMSEGERSPTTLKIERPLEFVRPTRNHGRQSRRMPHVP